MTSREREHRQAGKACVKERRHRRLILLAFIITFARMNEDSYPHERGSLYRHPGSPLRLD